MFGSADSTVNVSVEAQLGSSFIPTLSQGSSEIKRFAGVGVSGANDLGAALASLRGHAEAAAGSLGGVTSMIGKAGAFSIGVAGFLAIGGAVKQFVEAGIEAEKIERDLQAAVAITGVKWSAAAKQIEETVEALKKTTRFDDSNIKSALETMITLTGNVATSEQLMAATADFAAARHMKLGEASEIVSKALEGNLMTLRRSGVILNENTKTIYGYASETDRAAILQQVLNEKFGGRAQQDLETYAGKIAKLKGNIHDLEESIGQNLLKGLGELGDIIGKIATAPVSAGRGLGGFSPFAALAGAPPVEAPLDTSEGDAARDQSRLLAKIKIDHDAEEQRKKDLAAAAEAAKKYREELDAMLQTGEKVTRQERMLADAIADVDRRMGQGEGRKAFNKDLVTLAENLRRVGREVPANLLPNIPTGTTTLGTTIGNMPGLAQSFLDFFLGPAGKDAQEKFASDWAASMAQISDADREVQERFNLAQNRLLAATYQRIGEEFSRHVLGPLSDAFTDLAATGGKNFGQIMGQAWLQTVSEGAGKLTDLLIGVKPDATGQYRDAAGNPISREQAIGEATTKNPFLAGGLRAAEAGIGAYNTRGQTDVQAGLSAVLSGVGTAFAINWIAGVVVAVGAYLGHLFQPSPSQDYKLGSGGVDAFGRATFIGNENFDANAVADYTAKIQAQYETFFAGYNDLLRTLHQTVSPTFGVVPKVGRFEEGADLGLAASQQFEAELQRWINTGMPRQMAAHFYDAISKGFQQYGFSDVHFKEIWDWLDKLDPKKKLEILTTLGEAAVSLFTTMEFFNRFAGTASLGGQEGSIMAIANASMHQNFQDKIMEGDAAILELGEALKTAIGEDQINKAKQLGDLMQKRQDAEIAFAKQLLGLIEDAKNQLASDILGLNLEGKEGPQAKIDFLNQHYRDLQSQLSAATTPEEAERIRAELRQTIFSIKDLGGQLGPEAAAAFRAWAIEALTATNTAFNQKITDLGATLDTLNQDFTSRIKPVLDQFYTGLTSFKAVLPLTSKSLGDLDSAASSSAASLQTLSEAAGLVSQAFTDSNFIAFVRQSRASSVA